MFYLNGPFKLFITNIFIAFSYQILRNNIVPNQGTRVQYKNVIFDIFCNKSLFFVEVLVNKGMANKLVSKPGLHHWNLFTQEFVYSSQEETVQTEVEQSETTEESEKWWTCDWLNCEKISFIGNL